MRVFDEVGTWSLQRFALDGTNWELVDQQARKDAFLLQFDAQPGTGVLAAATCGSNGASSVKDSLCRIVLESDRQWDCRCFAYRHDEANSMRWEEFAPGNPPPAVTETSLDLTVQLDPEIMGAVLMQALPTGLFDSDGTTSKHQILEKADLVFDESACAQACGI